MEFTKVVAERYSCKNFSTRKVEAEKLTEILEAGRLAPTAKNFRSSASMCCSRKKAWQSSTR